MYEDQVWPLIRSLADSSDPAVAQQAGYLVQDYRDDEWWWLGIKPEALEGER